MKSAGFTRRRGVVVVPGVKALRCIYLGLNVNACKSVGIYESVRNLEEVVAIAEAQREAALVYVGRLLAA